MLQQLSHDSPTPDRSFTPRKEFIPEIKHAPNTFALLAVSHSNYVRLYSFPSAVVNALRNLFVQQNTLLSCREDTQSNSCQFSLDGKPWANARSFFTEKLLIDILAVIFQFGYSLLSALDYGREPDDRLAIAFAKLSVLPPTSRPPTPPSNTPKQDGVLPTSSERSFRKRVPFGISFISATLMRVISPPLHLTPAILQAVRASWPRGVVSEKKVGDNSFEFKLKGYKWFQYDNSAADSLQQILSLLSALDAHSFTLISSISLTTRSRVKDLWIFLGHDALWTEEVSHRDSSTASISNASHGEHKRTQIAHSPLSDSFKPFNATSAQHHPNHRRNASEPPAAVTGRLYPTSQHIRPASHQPVTMNPSLTQSILPTHTPGILRKPALRTQFPIPVVHELEAETTEGHRVALPSVVSSSVENMTGIGTRAFGQNIHYATSPAANGSATDMSSVNPTTDGAMNSAARLNLSQATSGPPDKHDLKRAGTVTSGGASSTLLGPGIFRNSVGTSKSDEPSDIPISWVSAMNALSEDSSKRHLPESGNANSVLSGRSAPSVATNGTLARQYVDDGRLQQDDKSHTPVHEVRSWVASPEVNRSQGSTRKSEAVVIEGTNRPSPALTSMMPRPRRRSSNALNGEGWVFVNIDRPTTSSDRNGSQASRSLGAGVEIPTSSLGGSEVRKGRRRFLSLGKKSPKTDGKEGRQSPKQDGNALSGLRNKLRLLGTPEAPRNESRRRSID